MEEKRLQLRVGFLILLAIGLLAGFILILGDFSVGKGFEFYAEFADSGDIATGAAVRLSGIRVGKVEEVQFVKDGKIDPKTSKRLVIRLKLWVEDRVKNLIRDDADVFITARGILGEKYVGIRPGSPKGKKVGPGGSMRGMDPPQTDLVIAKVLNVVDDVSTLLRRDGHLIRRVLKKGGDVMETVDAILKENRGQVSSLLAQAGGAMTKITNVIDDAKPIIRDLRGLISRVRRYFRADGRIAKILVNVDDLTGLAKREAPGLIKKIRTLADKATGLADKATGLVGDGRTLVRGINKIVGGQKNKIVKVVDMILDLGKKAQKVVGTINGIVGRIARGEGSIGAFLKDDELYDNIREMVRDIKQHPWKVLWKN